MVFTSYIYIFLFLPLTFLVSQLFRKAKIHNFILLAASYLFYSWGHVIFLIPLLYSSLADYCIGLKLEKTSNPFVRKSLVAASLLGNLSLLCFFKYTSWFISILNGLSGHLNLNVHIPPVQIMLLPGISFYTFRSLSYVIDMYRKEYPASRNLIDYLNFVSFFPYLLAGPIERAGRMLPQLTAIRPSVSAKQFEEGIFLIVWGLCKKIVFANNLNNLVNLSLESLHIPGVGLLAIYAFCFQIYCDFSAYTDIARGSAKLFNIELMKNFLTPYFSTSPADFWRRWHMSLSNWLRDYIYTPLAVSKRNWGKWGVAFALMITFILCGLWHGAGVFFLIWGAYQGLIMILYLFVPIDQILIKKLGWFGQLLAIFFMFQLTCIGWLLFRLSSGNLFLPITKNIASLFYLPLNSEIIPFLYGLCLFSFPIIITDFIGYRNQREFVDLYDKFSFSLKVVIYCVLFYLFYLFGKGESYDFIYFKF